MVGCIENPYRTSLYLGRSSAVQICLMSFIPITHRVVHSYAHLYTARLIQEKRLEGAFPLGADRENRTPDSSLARTRFTTKPYPRTGLILAPT